MPARMLDRWEPMSLAQVVEIFASAAFRWWISGGHALELHVGRSWRHHADVDVGVARCDLGSLHTPLSDWDLHVAAAGKLSHWRGEQLVEARQQNNVWCRRSPDAPWLIDITIGEGTEQNWIYRRDRTVQVPWDVAVLTTSDGVPYLSPALQLLFKSKDRRPKDDVDASEVVPKLEGRQHDLLYELFEPDHPWLRS